jgi:hypothetical protein
MVALHASSTLWLSNARPCAIFKLLSMIAAVSRHYNYDDE